MDTNVLLHTALLWALARPPALPEFGFVPEPPRISAGDQPGRQYRIDIPAGLLGDAVDRLASITGLHVRFADTGLRRLPSPRVAGTFTAAQALDALLAGTGVAFTFTAPDAVTLDIRTSETVSVTGSAGLLSSPKFTDPVRDTPHTVSVIPSIVIEQQAASSLRDALRNTPGITLTAGEGGAAPGDNLLIRGFSARNDVYIDGARDPGVVSRDTFNTEAIEVAKGPSSVTAGRGSTGGSVNLVTKSAMLQNAADFRFSAGNASQRRATFDVNRRLGGSVAFRVNGMLQDSGVPGRDEVTQKAWGFAPSLSVGLGKPTSATISY